ncbi:hypothetical protein [Streptomyces sp. wa22]|nr:hypothetical protein [Streptomyces sp. wa22]
MELLFFIVFLVIVVVGIAALASGGRKKPSVGRSLSSASMSITDW